MEIPNTQLTKKLMEKLGFKFEESEERKLKNYPEFYLKNKNISKCGRYSFNHHTLSDERLTLFIYFDEPGNYHYNRSILPNSLENIEKAKKLGLDFEIEYYDNTSMGPSYEISQKEFNDNMNYLFNRYVGDLKQVSLYSSLTGFEFSSNKENQGILEGILLKKK